MSKMNSLATNPCNICSSFFMFWSVKKFNDIIFEAKKPKAAAAVDLATA